MRRSSHPLLQVSARQVEILYLVGRDGLAWDDVQAVLGISPSTIRVHTERIIKKFECAHTPPREALTEIYWRYVAPSVDEAERDL